TPPRKVWTFSASASRSCCRSYRLAPGRRRTDGRRKFPAETTETLTTETRRHGGPSLTLRASVPPWCIRIRSAESRRGDLRLPEEPDGALGELDAEGLLVDGLQKACSQSPLHLDCGPNDHFRRLLVLEHDSRA